MMYTKDPLTLKGDQLSSILRQQRDVLDAAHTAVYHDSTKARAKLREAEELNKNARDIMDWLFQHGMFGGVVSTPMNIQGTADSRPPPWSNYILEVPRR